MTFLNSPRSPLFKKRGGTVEKTSKKGSLSLIKEGGRGSLKAVVLAFLFLSFSTSAHTFNLISAAQNEQGNRLYKKGQVSKARKAYQAAGKGDPKSPEIAFNLGNAYYKEQTFGESLKQYAGAALAEKDPAFRSRAFYNLGNALYRAGQTDKAIDAYKQALRLNPKDQDAKFNLELLNKKKDSPKPDEKKDQQKQDKNQDKNQQQQQQGGGGENQKDQSGGSSQPDKQQGRQGKDQQQNAGGGGQSGQQPDKKEEEKKDGQEGQSDPQSGSGQDQKDQQQKQQQQQEGQPQEPEDSKDSKEQADKKEGQESPGGSGGEERKEEQREPVEPVAAEPVKTDAERRAEQILAALQGQEQQVFRQQADGQRRRARALRTMDKDW